MIVIPQRRAERFSLQKTKANRYLTGIFRKPRS